MSEKREFPKCRTCGYELATDLNGDYFCLHSVIMEENHDDHFPRINPINEDINEFVEDLKQIEWLTNNENVDMKFYIKKWKKRREKEWMKKQ